MAKGSTSTTVGPTSWAEKAEMLGIDPEDGAAIENGGQAAVAPTEEEIEAAQEQARLEQEEADAAAAAEAEAEEEEPLNVAVPGLTPAAQKAFNKRVGKAVARQKAAEEAAAEAEARAVAAEEKAAAAEARMADQSRQEAVALGVHPDYLKPGEAEILKQDKDLKTAQDWCTAHYTEGYIGNGSEEHPEMTAAQVQRRWAELANERTAVAGRAALIRQRAQEEQDADRLAGRTGKNKPVTKPGATGAAPIKPTARRPVPPALALGGGTGTRRPIASAGGKTKSGFSQEALAQSPTKDTLAEQMSKFTG